MMKTHKVSRLRLAGGAAAVTLLAGLGLALGSPGFAAEQTAEAPKQDEARPREERREERVIIRTHRIGEGEHKAHAEGTRHSGHAEHDRRVIVRTHRGDGEGGHAGHGEHGDHHAHMFNMHGGHGGHGGHMALMAGCREGNSEIVNSDEASDGRRTRLMLCGPRDMDPARRLSALQHARDRLAGDDELSADSRARVLATLDREIARLRGN